VFTVYLVLFTNIEICNFMYCTGTSVLVTTFVLALFNVFFSKQKKLNFFSRFARVSSFCSRIFYDEDFSPYCIN